MSTEPLEFVSLEEVMAAGSPKEKHELFNEALNRVFNRAVETALLCLPETIPPLLKYMVNREEMAEKFFSQNPDMNENPAFREAVAELEPENPGWAYERLLDEAAGLARKRGAMLEQGPALDDASPESLDIHAADAALNGVI